MNEPKDQATGAPRACHCCRAVLSKYQWAIDLGIEHRHDAIIVDGPTGRGKADCRVRALPHGELCRWYVDLGMDNALALHNAIIKARGHPG